MAASKTPNLFTVCPGVSFLETCVGAYLDGRLVSGVDGASIETLAQTTIYVPTRRSARALAQGFAKALPQRVIFLPKIVPLGHLEDIENALAFNQREFDDAFIEDLPDAISETHRRLHLTRLIMQWAKNLRHAIVSIDHGGVPNVVESEPLLVATTALQAWNLSGDLARLIDDMIIEGVDWRALSRLAPDQYDQYWRITLEFLKIITQAWPAHLAESKQIDLAERQRRLVDMEIARMATDASPNAIIAIGSTGANQSTARLLNAIARHPRGAVVLPGLDKNLDEKAWSLINGVEAELATEGQPQTVLRRLLETIGASRENVVELGAPVAELQLRNRFVSEAMRPSEATDDWLAAAHAQRDDLASALANLTLIEAADEREEALCLAIEVRRFLESETATGALITPSQTLARRVKSELARWNIEADDSAGEPLALAPIGVLVRLVLNAATGPRSSVATIALLAHPIARFGYERAELTRLSALLEVGVWRAVLSEGLDPRALIEASRLAARTRDAHPAAAAIADSDWDRMRDVLIAVEEALLPLKPASAQLSAWVSAHEAALNTSVGELIGSEDAIALTDLFASLTDAQNPPIHLSSLEYAALIERMLTETIVRRSRPTHPRFKILGPLEARLLDADVVLLGGLDETIWPPATATDAFLNRPMRASLGLSAPERRIGQSAHDFVQALGAPKVIISRSLKREGAPTVPSRFLQRMAAFAGEAEWSKCRQRGAATTLLARQIDSKAHESIKRPAPRPPIAVRPTSLSVTRIETLRRDPYAIYAERILKLIPLASLDAAFGARENGNILHELMSELVRKFPQGEIPPTAIEFLEKLAVAKFGATLERPDFRAFRWPRIAGSLSAAIAWENARREDIVKIDVEKSGKLPIKLADNSIFILTAQADRIERRRDGSLVAIDFKTGQPPSAKVVAAGFAPQLTLEAAMLKRNAFADIPEAHVANALYVKIQAAEIFKERAALEKKESLADLAEEHFIGLKQLLDQFRLAETPYTPRPFPQFINKFSDYDHLARVGEWSSGGIDGAGE